MSNRFDSEKYVDDYLKKGAFPAIHNEIVSLIMLSGVKGSFIDLGCSTGLISVQLIKKGIAQSVTAIDSSVEAIDRAVKADGITYVKSEIKSDSIKNFRWLIEFSKVKSIVARRVFPEISGGDAGFIRELSAMFYDAGIENIFIEGRVNASRSKHCLKCLDDEVDCFKEHYFISDNGVNCVWLERREGVSGAWKL